jgi:putative spermidine/putrescine transport system permease protein
VSLLATALGIPASFGLVRGRFPGRKMLNAYFMLPMIVPVIVVAIAVYSIFLQLGLTGTFIGFVLAHTILALPFTIISITTALRGFEQDIERAAIICGANPMRAKVTITLRNLLVGVSSGALFAFLISWDEVVIALFMSTPSMQTLPIKMWTTLRLELNPLVAVAGSLLALLSLVAMGAIVLVVRWGGTPWRNKDG